MIEIAISLAVIAFALVAIIGILPAGMTVQRENREETIINQEASMLMSGIRSGARGMDDLTNYVFAITNYAGLYNVQGNLVTTHNFGYTLANSTDNGTPTPVQFPITNGLRIIGLLTTPWNTPDPTTPGQFYSNHVVAFVRSMSGAAFEKTPQDNTTILDAAFSYRLIADVHRFDTNGYFDASWTNYNDPLITGNTNEIVTRSNYWMIARNLQSDMYDLRLIFRWPILPNGSPGPGRQVYRTTVSGYLLLTNDFGFSANPPYSLYFFEPRTYVKAP